jgi:hypothetical protein
MLVDLRADVDAVKEEIALPGIEPLPLTHRYNKLRPFAVYFSVFTGHARA